MAESPPAVLLWGEDAFLVRQAATEILDARGVKARELDAREWHAGDFFDLATPSLWGERRALLVTGCQSLPEAAVRELKRYLESPSPDAVCVLTMATARKTAPALAKVIQGAGGRSKQVALRRQEFPKWTLERAKARGIRLSPAGAAALVGVIGEDAGPLDQAVEQLASAFPDRVVGPDEVHEQFQGAAEHQIWDLCDRAFSGRLAEAMAILHALLVAREDPLFILGGIASRLRDLLRVSALPDTMPPAEAARQAGLRFDWQVRKFRDQARIVGRDSLPALHERAVESDRALKGGLDAESVLAALVAAIAGDREAALSVPVRVSR
ncbi:MAG TPA: DNA polymerase III subunit delta [Actinomycetota bacterium]|nr:DNA polymerase III subunit delta [Actinomycetota bacterium]